MSSKEFHDDSNTNKEADAQKEGSGMRVAAATTTTTTKQSHSKAIDRDDVGSTSSSSTRITAEPIEKTVQRARLMNAACTLCEGIRTRCESEEYLAYFLFVKKDDGKPEIVPVPDTANLLRISNTFSGLPKKVRTGISRNIPAQEKEAYLLLTDWLSSVPSSNDWPPLSKKVRRLEEKSDSGTKTELSGSSAEPEEGRTY